MREDDALGILVEFEHLEFEFLIELCTASVSLDKMLGCCESFHTVGESYDCALLYELDDSSLVYRAYSEDSLEYIPGILLKLLVAERETTVLLVDLEHLDVNVGTDLSELAGVLYLLGP